MSDRTTNERVDIWIVVMHHDYSGSKVFENKEAAIALAKNIAREWNQQVAVYSAKVSAVAMPQESTVEWVP